MTIINLLYTMSPLIVTVVILLLHVRKQLDSDKSLGKNCYRCGSEMYKTLFQVPEYKYQLCESCKRDIKLNKITGSVLKIKSLIESLLIFTIENHSKYLKIYLIMLGISIMFDLLLFSTFGIQLYLTTTIINLWWIIWYLRCKITHSRVKKT